MYICMNIVYIKITGKFNKERKSLSWYLNFLINVPRKHENIEKYANPNDTTEKQHGF